MLPPKRLFLLIALDCLLVLGVALYLQIAERMLPCPLCVLQRYAFLASGACALWAACTRGRAQLSAGVLSLCAALAGLGVALHHVWILHHPALSCGIDPLETVLNRIPPAIWLPTLFRADGLCDLPYPPILGLSIPAWAALHFTGIALLWIGLASRRRRQ